MKPLTVNVLLPAPAVKTARSAPEITNTSGPTLSCESVSVKSASRVARIVSPVPSPPAMVPDPAKPPIVKVLSPVPPVSVALSTPDSTKTSEPTASCELVRAKSASRVAETVSVPPPPLNV